MMKNGRCKVVLVGLGFGGAFAPIWKDHPAVTSFGICDLDRGLAEKVAKLYGIESVYDSFEDVLADPEVDAVHLVTTIPDHAAQTVRVLRAGKHCACTVPMATSLEDVQAILDAERESGKHFMMMETTLYTYQFRYVQKMLRSGEMGRIQFLRGSHYQDMENWPAYWKGLPPFWYGTHAVAPLAALAGAPITRVSCLGSGTMREELRAGYGNPYPIETAHFVFANGLAAEATRSLFETARTYQEGLFVYGSKKSFEWGFGDGDPPYVTSLLQSDGRPRGLPTPVEVIDSLPNDCEELPEPLRPYTVGGNYDPTNPQLSLKKGAGGGHHGSHPYLVDAFARCITQDTKPAIGSGFAANVSAAILLAHESALRGGEWLDVPSFA